MGWNSYYYCLYSEHVPTKKLKNKVPEEVRSGKRPLMSHLMVFSSISDKRVLDDRRRNLDDKSEPIILVGYHKTEAYKLFNLMSDKTVMIRDIVIDENSAWDWNSGDATNNPLISYDFDEESCEHEEILLNNIPVTVEVEAKNREGVASTSQRPQRTRVLPARL